MDSNLSAWNRFTADPRTHPDLRASDSDRNVVFDVLGDAFATGQLDAAEHAERMETAASIRTLSDIEPLLSDLLAPDGTPSGAHGAQADDQPSLARLEDTDIPLTPEAIDEAAHAYWRRVFGGTLAGFIAPVAITVTIWIATGANVFFWPLFVILGTGMGFLNTITNRQKMIADRKRVLNRRARAHLGDEDAQREIREHPGRYEIDDDAAARNARRELRHGRRHDRRSNGRQNRELD